MQLTETQWNTLRAAMDRVVPPDEYPGAWETGVGDYLARQFQGDLEPLLPLYQDGLDALDTEARSRHKVTFALLDAARQDALLQDISAGNVQTEWPVTPANFFNALVHHVHEGFYADPSNGGNRDGVAWQMIGFTVDPMSASRATTNDQ
jgi:hypothetical protein